MDAAVTLLLSVGLAGANLARRTLRRPYMPTLLLLVPLALCLLLAAGYGAGAVSRIGLAGPADSGVAAAIRSGMPIGEPHLPVVEPADAAALREQVERGPLDLGVIVPDEAEALLAEGRTVEVALLTPPGAVSPVLREVVRAAVREASVEPTAARLVADALGVPWTEALPLVAGRPSGPGVVVELDVIGTTVFPPGVDPFALAARSLVVLFAFLAPVLAVPLVVVDRRSGVLRRPVAGRRSWLVVGEVLGLVMLALFPGATLAVSSSLLLGVAWGDPLAVGLLLVATALAGGGLASVLAGWVSDGGSLVFRLVVVFAAAALGGTLVPLELIGGDLRSAAFAMPHAWALEGLRRTMLEGAGVPAVAIPLGVLAGAGTLLLALGIAGVGRATGRPVAGAAVARAVS